MAIDGRNLKVLYVSEANVDQSPTGQALKNAGYRIESRAKACEASRLAAREKFDCIIIDCLLRTGTADQVVLALRASKTGVNTETPIILLSRNFDQDLLSRLDRHISMAIKKPVTPAQLVKNVDGLCQASAAPSDEYAEPLLSKAAA